MYWALVQAEDPMHVVSLHSLPNPLFFQLPISLVQMQLLAQTATH